MVKKGDMKSAKWINAYENNNVDIGLKCGFSGKAQIGKGMWAMPDQMSKMMEQKIGHPKSGANCAWVPSPTAAILHSMHYHKINVFNEQKKIKQTLRDISHDMKELGVVTQVINDNGKGYKTYGKGFTNPEQLMKSINEEQTFRFLTSKMSRNVESQRIEEAVGMPGIRNYFPIGRKDGGLVSVEEMLGSDNG